jgi:hypothetical protein
LVTGDPKGFGPHDYDGGHNEIGYVNKVVDYYVSILSEFHIKSRIEVMLSIKTLLNFFQSKPEYAFGYEVEDYYNKLSHGRWEVRNGDVTQVRKLHLLSCTSTCINIIQLNLN